MEQFLRLILAVLRGQNSYSEVVEVTPSAALIDPPLDAIWVDTADAVSFEDVTGASHTQLLPAQQFYPVRIQKITDAGSANVTGFRI